MQLKVFVVDDDQYYARLISYRLSKQPGCEVQVFDSGESLLAHVGETPDVIFLDVMMPGMGGIEALRKITDRHPGVPVLVVSAQGVHATAARAIELGAYDYITKGQDDLLRLEVVIRNVAERKRLQDEVRTLRGGSSTAYRA